MRRQMTGLLAFVLAFTMAVQPVYAARTKEEVQQEKELKKNEQKNTQSQYKEAQGKLGDLQDEQDQLAADIEELDAALVEILASVALMEEQITDTEAQIVQAQTDYDAAKAQEDAQYQAIKKRLRFLYEKGETSYMELLTRATGFGEMLNQAGYIEKLYEYDRKMLNQYIAVKEEVAVKKSALEDKKSELEAQRHELDEEKAGMEELLEEKKSASADYEAQIARVKQEAATYKALIKKQNAELAKLQEEENAIIREEEARRKAEEAKKAAASKANTSSSSSVTSSASGLKSVPPATGSSGSDIARYACQFVGNPYVAGGTSLTGGADCSGFIWAVYKQYGYNLPRNSYGQRNAGRAVSYEEAQPGDIICYAGHVALYLGGGRIVHASTARTGIKYGYATYRPILAVRRIVG